MMKGSLCIWLTFCWLMPSQAQRPDEFRLWPDNAETTDPQSLGADFDRDESAFLTLYRPADTGKPAPAVVICPGGSYLGVAIGHEGYDVARWYVGQGFAAVVLKYRMPRGNYDVPRQDVQRAIELVRANAGLWNIDPSRVGVMGFSAGGHLASTAATHFTCAADRPDFAVLIYPVISMDPAYTHALSRRSLLGDTPGPGLVAAFSNELRVTPQTPPTFIAFSDDDDVVDPRNGTLFYDALRSCGVAGELHIYPVGGHGWGWLETFRYREELRTSLARWLHERTAQE